MADPVFQDVHSALVAFVHRATGVRTSSKIPGDLTTEAIVVLDVTGSDDSVTDTTTFDVQTFAPTRKRAWELSEAVRTLLLGAAGQTEGPVLFDSIRTRNRPVRVTYGNPDVTRYVASYQVSTRSQ